MEYIFNYYDGSKIPTSISFKSDKVILKIFLTPKYHRLDILISNKNIYNRKKIDISNYLNEIIKFLNNNTLMVPFGKDYVDLFNIDNVKRIELSNLKLENKDIQLLSKFNNINSIETDKCTFYKDCNLGILKCDLIDYNSDVYSLDSLNGYSGGYISFQQTHIVRMNKNLLHLNNQVLELSGVNMNYELFFLTTDAPNMRRLDIYRCPKLKKLQNKDLLFISGFYNLEAVNIDGIVDNYDQFDKLEKLRELQRVILLNVPDKYKNNKYYIQALKEGFSDTNLNNILCNIRLYNQNKYCNLRHKLYVPRLERIEFENNISNQSLEEIKQKLIDFYKLDYYTRKNYLKEKAKEITFFDERHKLYFDEFKRKDEDDLYILTNSSLFDYDGIDYYVKNKKIILDR
jgi:hypothetical protein